MTTKVKRKGKTLNGNVTNQYFQLGMKSTKAQEKQFADITNNRKSPRYSQVNGNSNLASSLLSAS